MVELILLSLGPTTNGFRGYKPDSKLKTSNREANTRKRREDQMVAENTRTVGKIRKPGKQKKRDRT